ncbi:RNA polymerase sigma factor [Streptomyces nymphaeiformis]|uniref:RNA polymerase sigma-70 factor (Sigma-E family) n=1 Tax=Streptomyces nymphaeiformis TaxID=2663842 RepID=A0A7W7U9C1_9ACTN|nr:sigma-70 family RNA polymerase sigma factor [Streptomyces nymphaeiformis]MBB4986055.1 RNA polymerase sigma-70 factor (sigma-E family) [Streptomyces nymphaeiformis]
MPYALPLTMAPPWWSRLLARVSRAARDTRVPVRERHLRAVGAPYDGEPAPTLTELYRARRLDMVRLALFLVDDLPTAEDVVQDAFAALCRAYGTSLDGLQDPGAYLHTAVVNAARSLLRRRRTARAYTPPHPGSGAPVDEGLLLAEEHRQVLDALAELTRRQREVLVLRYWSELTEAQIAQTLGLSRGTVKSTASRALDALERRLEKRLDTEPEAGR